jgi:hypothetical protein
MSAPITYAGHTWPSAYEWCLWVMQHNAAPGPAQNGQRAALAAYRNQVLDEVAAKLLSMGTPEDEGVHGVWETAILTVSGMKNDV